MKKMHIMLLVFILFIVSPSNIQAISPSMGQVYLCAALVLLYQAKTHSFPERTGNPLLKVILKIFDCMHPAACCIAAMTCYMNCFFGLTGWNICYVPGAWNIYFDTNPFPSNILNTTALIKGFS